MSGKAAEVLVTDSLLWILTQVVRQSAVSRSLAQRAQRAQRAQIISSMKT